MKEEQKKSFTSSNQSKSVIQTKYPKYKDSHIAWLGQIPEHWEVRKFKYISHLITTKSNTNLKKVGLENIQSNTGKFLNTNTEFEGSGVVFRPSDILFGKLRPYLSKVYLSDFNGQAVGDFFVFRSSELILPKFLFYCILNRSFINLTNGSTFGAKMPRVSWDFIANLRSVLPPLPEQTQIAAFLDYKLAKIDRFIRKKKQLIKLLNEQKAAIINQAVTKGLDPNAKMKPSGIEWLGDIPEHWEVKKLKYIGKCQNGISAGAEYFGSGFPFISYGDVYNDFQLPITGSGLANSSEHDRINYSVKKGDVFFTRTSETVEEIGFTSTCLTTIENATFSGFLIRFRPYPNSLFEGFSKYFFRSNLHRRFFVKEMNLVTRASLSQELLKRMPVLLPPIEEQNSISNHIDYEVDKIHKTISTIEKEITLTQEYKTALIAEAVTGKIDVRDFEIHEAQDEETYEDLEEDPDGYRESEAAEDEAEYQNEEMEE